MTNIYKIVLAVCGLLASTTAFGQPPANYYNPAQGLTGFPLKTALHNIIKNHTVRSYAQLWTDYQTTDKKPNNKVWDMYSDIPSGTPPYEYTFVTNQCGSYNSEGDCYNREHTVPQSAWTGTNPPQYSDMFHVVPTDGYVNGIKGNNPFGTVASPTLTTQNGSKSGPCSFPGYTGTVFEPIDAYKGDLARGYFYMATRYQDVISTWNFVALNGTDSTVFTAWTLNMLHQWHIADPVSAKEIARNNAIYGFQNNRNPYIDNPQWVDSVWGFTTGLATAHRMKAFFEVFPNPAHDELTINAEQLEGNRAQLSLYNTLGQVLIQESIDLSSNALANYRLNISTLPQGVYTLRLANGHSLVQKRVVKQ